MTIKRKHIPESSSWKLSGYRKNVGYCRRAGRYMRNTDRPVAATRPGVYSGLRVSAVVATAWRDCDVLTVLKPSARSALKTG